MVYVAFEIVNFKTYLLQYYLYFILKKLNNYVLLNLALIIC